MGSGHTLGKRGGEQGHTLSISELPTHVHSMNATSATATPNTNPGPTVMLAQASGDNIYNSFANAVALDPRAAANVGGSQAHLNMQPFLVLNFSIALQGIFPSQT